MNQFVTLQWFWIDEYDKVEKVAKSHSMVYFWKEERSFVVVCIQNGIMRYFFFFFGNANRNEMKVSNWNGSLKLCSLFLN